MAKQASLEIEPVIEPAPVQICRVPVATAEVAARIQQHLVATEANRRLVRVRDGWVMVSIGKNELEDIEVLGRKLGVLADCEAMV